MLTIEGSKPDFGCENGAFTENTQVFEAGLSEHCEVNKPTALQFVWRCLRLQSPEFNPALSQHFGHAEARNDPFPHFEDPRG